MNTTDTIVAIATAPGLGAIGVIRLSGKDAIFICQKVFKGADLTLQKSHTIHYGFVMDGALEIDEVMVSIFHAPKSFTTENSIEISCHGSPYIQQQIVEVLIKKGARLAKAGEFTLRAFLHGRIDLSQAEAVADLIASANKSQHEMALQQMKGGLSNEIKSLREQLLNFASLIELELDFGEEDVEFADRLQLESLIEKIIQHINPILESFHLGNAIKNGIPTAIIGRPNAGKSSLLNVLLNDERAIVTEIAGTTRDTIEEQFIIKGISFRLIDTAGMRESDDLVEKMGIQKTYEKIGEAQLILYVYDVNLLTVAEVLADIKPLLKEGHRVIICANKSDLLKTEFPTSSVDAFSQSLAEHFAAFVLISTNAKTNIELLKNELVKDYFSTVTQHHVILTNARHVDALATAKESLEAVLTGVRSHITGDFLSIDIKRSLHALAEISGEVTNDEVLGNIFSKFCIGK